MRRPLSAQDEKRLRTAIARAALKGITIHRIEGDFLPEVFICTKWAMTREFTDLGALERWLDLVTGLPLTCTTQCISEAGK